MLTTLETLHCFNSFYAIFHTDLLPQIHTKSAEPKMVRLERKADLWEVRVTHEETSELDSVIDCGSPHDAITVMSVVRTIGEIRRPPFQLPSE